MCVCVYLYTYSAPNIQHMFDLIVDFVVALHLWKCSPCQSGASHRLRAELVEQL